jgi:hypothetical protein
MQQIEQMGQVLAQLLAYLLGLKGTGSASLSLDEIRQNYSDKLNLPLDLILETPGEKIVQLLTEKVKYMDRHLEEMGDILCETALVFEDAGDRDTSRDLNMKALIIFSHLQDTENSFSMGRMQKISWLKEKL